MRKERRKLTRFWVEENAYITLGVTLPRIGRIIDISRGGLSFEYHADYLRDKTDRIILDENFSEANIYVLRNGFSLSDLPCLVVYDVVEYILANSFIVKKRCGVEFREITDNQAMLLRNFLADHTTGLIVPIC